MSLPGRRRVLLAGLVAALAVVSACDEDTPVAPSLSATCSASPSSGRAPLTVSFGLNVSGAQGAFSVSVDYGDGAAGTDPGSPHTYAGTGTFTAGFTVRTATQSARCSTVIQVDPAPTPSPTPTPVSENRPPDAVFRTTPEAAPGRIIRGVPPLTVRFNMCATTDPERDPRRYKMDLDGDGGYEVDGSTGGDCRRSHTYRSERRYSPEMCVTDIDASSRVPLHPFQCKTYSVRVKIPTSD